MGEGEPDEATLRHALEALSAGLDDRQRPGAIREMAAVLIAAYAARGAAPPTALAAIVVDPLPRGRDDGAA